MRAGNAKALVARYIEEVWNGADAAAFTRLTGPGYGFYLGRRPPLAGAAMLRFIRSVHTAFPDWRVRIRALAADGELVAVRWDGRVTHSGPFHGIAPTGREIEVCGINIYLLDKGAIAREWEQTDSLGMLEQMGITSADR